jgi:hypothetical protein
MVSPISNGLVQGLTFSGATSVNVLASLPCAVTFEDCIFEKNNNVASIFIDGGHSEIEDEWPNVLISVVESYFLSNTVGMAPRQSSGVITNRGGSLYLKGNKFFGTKTSPAEPVREDHSPNSDLNTIIGGAYDSKTFVGYVVGNLGGTMYLQENCFVNNEATIAPVVSWNGEINTSSNGGSTATESPCHFLALIQGEKVGLLTSDLPFTCVPYDGHICPMASGEDISESNRSPSTKKKPSHFTTSLYCFVALVFLVTSVVLLYFFAPRFLRRRRPVPSPPSEINNVQIV